jgi:hypothetical protein
MVRGRGFGPQFTGTYKQVNRVSRFRFEIIQQPVGRYSPVAYSMSELFLPKHC